MTMIANIGRIQGIGTPMKFFTSLKIRTQGGLLDAALAGASKVYRPTSYFDLEPDVGGGSFGGYAFYAAGYGRYRVLSFDYKISLNNLQSDACQFGVYPIPSGTTPSELYSTNNVEVASENPYGKVVLLGPTGGVSTALVTGHVDCVKVWGTPEAATAEGWAGITGSSPSANTWLLLTAERLNLTALSTGVQYVLELVAHGYWDSRTTLVG